MEKLLAEALEMLRVFEKKNRVLADAFWKGPVEEAKVLIERIEGEIDA